MLSTVKLCVLKNYLSASKQIQDLDDATAANLLTQTVVSLHSEAVLFPEQSASCDVACWEHPSAAETSDQQRSTKINISHHSSLHTEQRLSCNMFSMTGFSVRKTSYDALSVGSIRTLVLLSTQILELNCLT